MDSLKLTEVLKATIDPSQREEAERKLAQFDQSIGFSPALLQIVMLSDAEMPVRQAGVIYLKNLLTKSWVERAVSPEHPQSFSIHEQDREIIRNTIVDAVIHAPDRIRIQLLVCVRNIMKHDFPTRCIQIVDKIANYLQNPDSSGWIGALLCLYQLVKTFQYKPGERGPLNEAMKILLPMLYQMCIRLLSENTEESIYLQKQILKIYFAYTEYSLPLVLFSSDVFTSWMEIFRTVADITIVGKQNDTNSSVWKCKKWSLRILLRMFEKYGSPGNVSKEYTEFSVWYLKSFSIAILSVLSKLLEAYKQKMFVSPPVLQHTLNYLNEAVGHAFSWKYLKPHMTDIIQNVLFPILSYSESDEELWESDPYEYIRVKFDTLETYMTKEMAAQSLLQLCCKKRKGMLEKTMHFATQVLTSPHADASHKDGALHMIGNLMDILLTKKKYKDQLNKILSEFVFPQFVSERGHMRARASWMIQRCSEMRFKPQVILEETVRLITNALLNDKDLPVKVQAAIALKMILKAQERSEKYLEPNIKQITLELLTIIRETKNDNMSSVLQEIVHAYTDQLVPVAVDICQHLAITFAQMLEGADDKDISAIGLLNTIDTLLTVMEDQPGIMLQLQPPTLSIIGSIFTQRVSDLYEEALFLVDDLTAKRISADMWSVLELLYQIFQRDAFDYFADMMAALHNFITVDTDTFLSNNNYIMIIFNMCNAVLSGNSEEDSECHAAKLLEVVIFQCKGRIDHCIPSFIELIMQRLNRGVKSSELRTMCLQVSIAALCYNPQLFFSTLDKIQMSTPSSLCITTQFIKQWVHDLRNFLGIHDRKVCILGICTLLSLPGPRPVALEECASKIMPALIMLFQGLKRARESLALEGDDDDDDDEDDDDFVEYMDQDVLSSDESDIDEEKQEYMEKLEIENRRMKDVGGALIDMLHYSDKDEFNEDAGDLYEETDLESYTTILDDRNSDVDEYIIFKSILQNLEAGDPSWYKILIGHLQMKQRKALEEILILSDQRKAAAESRKIEQRGGYSFVQQAVPTSFKFGATSGDQ